MNVVLTLRYFTPSQSFDKFQVWQYPPNWPLVSLHLTPSLHFQFLCLTLLAIYCFSFISNRSAALSWSCTWGLLLSKYQITISQQFSASHCHLCAHRRLSAFKFVFWLENMKENYQIAALAQFLWSFEGKWEDSELNCSLWKTTPTEFLIKTPASNEYSSYKTMTKNLASCPLIASLSANRTNL